MAKEKKVSDFIKDIIDEYGEDSILVDDDVEVISTGSLSLDISLGIGGIPVGMYTEISGPESSGKTTTALTIVREAIKAGKKVMYIDVERALDYGYTRQIIGDDVHIITDLEEIDDDVELVVTSPELAEEALGIAEAAIDSGIFGLVILDSIGALAPKKEKEDNLEDSNVALTPRLLTKWLRRNSYSVKNNRVAFVFLNQVRAKIGSYMGGYETPGGYALKHYIGARIEFRKGKKIESTNREKIGVLTKFTITKNKKAPPYRSGILPIMYGTGIDYYRDVLEFTKRVGVVRMAGAYYRFEGETLGQGMDNSIKTLKENKETLDKIVKMCYNTLTKKGKE